MSTFATGLFKDKDLFKSISIRVDTPYNTILELLIDSGTYQNYNPVEALQELKTKMESILPCWNKPQNFDIVTHILDGMEKDQVLALIKSHFLVIQKGAKDGPRVVSPIISIPPKKVSPVEKLPVTSPISVPSKGIPPVLTTPQKDKESVVFSPRGQTRERPPLPPRKTEQVEITSPRTQQAPRTLLPVPPQNQSISALPEKPVVPVLVVETNPEVKPVVSVPVEAKPEIKTTPLSHENLNEEKNLAVVGQVPPPPPLPSSSFGKNLPKRTINPSSQKENGEVSSTPLPPKRQPNGTTNTALLDQIQRFDNGALKKVTPIAPTKVTEVDGMAGLFAAGIKKLNLNNDLPNTNGRDDSEWVIPSTDFTPESLVVEKPVPASTEKKPQVTQPQKPASTQQAPEKSPEEVEAEKKALAQQNAEAEQKLQDALAKRRGGLSDDESDNTDNWED